MALVNSENLYIKLEVDGSFEIYSSEEARLKIKQSTTGETILAKYRELITELEQQSDFMYYDPKGFVAQYALLQKEYQRYCYNFTNHIVGQEYPIMTEIYPDVTESIPEIIEAGQTLLDGNSLEELYVNAKQVKRFGETTDA
jgi:hypothetical protein